MGDPEAIKPIGSLVNFTKLRELELSVELIIWNETHIANQTHVNYQALANIFPPSLETMTIPFRDITSTLILETIVRSFPQLLAEIARACKMEMRLPNLKIVNLKHTFERWSRVSVGQAEDLLKDTGIELFHTTKYSGIEDTHGWGGCEVCADDNEILVTIEDS